MQIEVLDDLGVVFDQKVIGNSLRAARLAARVSFRELAKQSGISATQILRMEAGETEYAISRFVRLCACLGLPLGDVLEDAMRDRIGNKLMNVAMFPAVVEAVARAQAAGREPETTLVNIELFARHIYTTAAAALLGSRPEFNQSVESSPSEHCRAALKQFAKVVSKSSSAKRLVMLRGLVSQPLETLASLGLLVGPTLDDVAALGNISLPGRQSMTLAKTIVEATQAGPKARRTMAKMGVQVLGVVGENKSGVDKIPLMGNKSAVPDTLESLIARVKMGTAERGAKTNLAKDLIPPVTPQRFNEWLAGRRKPGGEHTLQLREKFPPVDEVKTKKAATADTATAKTPKEKQHENDSSITRPRKASRKRS